MDGPAVFGQSHTAGMDNMRPAVPEAGEQRKAQGQQKKTNSTKAKTDASTKESHDIAELGKDSTASKTRKRTKTGCLSKPSRLKLAMNPTNICKHAANVVSSAVKSDQPAATV